MSGYLYRGKGQFTGRPLDKVQVFKVRTIPFSLKDKVETELERLQRLGIITPVKHSNWATPVVPVLKQNGTITLYGDYR